MRNANQVQELPRSLLIAAASCHFHGDPASACQLLDEAHQIAECSAMPLHLADVHLHRARLVGMLSPDQRAKYWPGIDPKAELAKARALIEKHGYWRRREELADAETASVQW